MNKSKVAVISLSTMLAGTILGSGVMFHNNANTIKDSNIKINKAEKKIETLKKDIETVKNEKEDMFNKKTEAEETVKRTKESHEYLFNKNKELQEKLNKIESIPQWNPDNVIEKSNVSELGLKLSLKDTGLKGLESSFIKAEQEYGINALFLTAITAQESSWGNSDRAKRDNNLSGYAVYNDASEGRSFESKEEAIMATAKLLKEHYVSEGRYDIYSINDKYTPVNGHHWSNSINSIAQKLQEKANINNYL